MTAPVLDLFEKSQCPQALSRVFNHGCWILPAAAVSAGIVEVGDRRRREFGNEGLDIAAFGIELLSL